MFLSILNDYQRRFFDDHSNLRFLQQFSINFYEDRNELDFFYLRKAPTQMSMSALFGSIKSSMSKYLVQSNFRESEDPEEVIEGYIK